MEKPVPLEEVTTNSLDALKAYTTGSRLPSYAAAVGHYQRAIAFDPSFAMAYAALGINSYNSGQTEKAAAYSRKGYQLRQRASAREKFFIDYNYDRNYTGNLEKALRTLELWAHTYPQDVRPHSLIAGKVTLCTGRYEKTLEESEIAIRMDPDHRHEYNSLTVINIHLGRLPQAEDALKHAAERKIDDTNFLSYRYYIAFLKGDQAGMEQQVRAARGRQGGEDWLAHHQAMVLAYSGRLIEARGMWLHSTDLARQTNDGERAAVYQTGAALTLPKRTCRKQQGSAPVRRGQALDLSKGEDVEYGAAHVLAISGESGAAQKLVDDLNKRFPEDTIVQSIYLPTLRALIALRRSDPRQAIAELQVTLPYDLAMPRNGVLWLLRRALFGVCARRGVSGGAPRSRSSRGISEDSREPGDRFRRSHRGAGALATGPCLGVDGREVQGKDSLPGLPRAVEERRPGYPCSDRSQKRLCGATLVPSYRKWRTEAQ